MRAHKFSLVWFGWKIADLSRLRAQYVGHDAIVGLRREELPDQCEETLVKLADRDDRKALVLRRYFEEMRTVIAEMRRVLKGGRPAVIVVGSSTLRGLDVETHKGLVAIGEGAGLVLAGIGARLLDRDRRMMPARWGQRTAFADRGAHAQRVRDWVGEAVMPGRIEALRRAYHLQIATTSCGRIRPASRTTPMAEVLQVCGLPRALSRTLGFL